MNQSLQPGQNTTLSQPRGQVRVSHTLDAGLDVNLTAFLVTASGKVTTDDDMVFFNAPQHASEAATFMNPTISGNTLSHCIDFDLSRLPAGIVKIAVTLTQDGGAGGFASVKDLQAHIVAGEQSLALAPGAFSQETGIIVLELYVRNGDNKARAVWQGFNSGLAGLCNLYGIEVEAPAPVTPAVSLKKITLTKPNVQHKVSLIKGAAAPESIRVSATWVDNGDDEDNDDLDLRIGILRPDGQMSLVCAPDNPGAFEAYPWLLHGGDVVTASACAPGTETVEINPAISRLMGGKVAIVCSVYSAVSNGAVSVASLKPTMRMEYGEQVVECAYDFDTGDDDEGIYTYVIGLIEIDEDSIVLSPAGVTSEEGSEDTPWLTRKGDKVVLTVDGPWVFKGGKPATKKGKRYV